MNDENLFVRMGWKCPCCGRVYSPDTSMCLYCGNTENTIEVNGTIKVKETDPKGNIMLFRSETGRLDPTEIMQGSICLDSKDE